MSRHAAFLRGVNLGGRRVKMARLRGLFEGLGLEGVASHGASGNVVFDHPGTGLRELEAEIEAHLEEVLGWAVDTFVRSFDDLRRVAGHEAVAAAREDGVTPHAIFLRREATPEVVEALEEVAVPEDRFEVLGREVLRLRRGGMADAPVSPRDLEAALGPEHTSRKLTTVERVLERFGE
jgi:uncharacterized protein (DUF1697 family)